MGIFGWSLPPGVSMRDLPGNRPEEQAAEALMDLIYDQFPSTMSDDDMEKLSTWISDQIGKAYNEGYQQAVADRKEAETEEYSDAQEQY